MAGSTVKRSFLPPMQEPGTRMRAKQITLVRAEGKTGETNYPSISLSFEAANATLRGWSNTAPGQGEGCHKCDYEVEYENGHVFRGRFDLYHWMVERADLADTMRRNVALYAGLWEPAHFKRGDAARFLSNFLTDPRPDMLAFWNTYAIGDEAAEPLPEPASQS